MIFELIIIKSLSDSERIIREIILSALIIFKLTTCLFRQKLVDHLDSVMAIGHIITTPIGT